MNLILCGMPMSGKTTIGKRLAEELGCPFIDTDQLIEKAYGNQHSCREIFTREGSEYFRELEHKQIASLSNVTNSVIAVGGGSLSNPGNTEVLQNIGELIYLKVDPSILLKRMHQRGTPAYLKDTSNGLLELFEQRQHNYESAASLTIDTYGLTETDIVSRILEKRSLKHGQ